MHIFDGKLVSRAMLENLRDKIILDKIKPVLAIILVGNDEASKIYVNLKKEEEKRRGEIGQFAKLELLLELLDLADSFELAFANKEAWEKVDANWRTGIEYIYQKLIDLVLHHPWWQCIHFTCVYQMWL